MVGGQLDETLARLSERGVIIVDPRQTYVAPDVDVERVCAGAILHASTRLYGPRTFVGPGAEVGVQGPATLVDAVLAPGAKVDAGYLEGAVLLASARVGWGGHLRPGTLLEEHASTAHCVGLKHTILLSFATVGSVVNLCDALVAGGTSKDDHSEVGSGFIHFNFTPWGTRGDKATASLFGDVVHGVFLRERRIFLGGAGGVIGPRRVGFGAITAAGQIVRRDVPADRVVLQPAREIDRGNPHAYLDPAGPRASANVAYLAQLCALRAWYRAVRLPRAEAVTGVVPGRDRVAARAVVEAALATVDLCIAERRDRLAAFLRERGVTAPSLSLEDASACPIDVTRDPDRDHVAWVQALGEPEVAACTQWLQAVADRVVATAAISPRQ